MSPPQLNHDTTYKIVTAVMGTARNQYRIIDHGWNNLVIVVDEEVVLRIPRSTDAEGKLYREAQLSKLLATHVTVATPLYSSLLTCSDVYPLTIGIYDYIKGESPDIGSMNEQAIVSLASELAIFLDEIRSVPVKDLKLLNLHKQSDYKAVVQWYRARLESSFLTAQWAKVPDEVVVALDVLETSLQECTSDVLTHGDLKRQHVVCCDERVSGIIDFAEAGLGDPVVDFAGIIQSFGVEFCELLMNNYIPGDAHLFARAQIWTLRLHFESILYAFADNDLDQVVNAVEGLAVALARARGLSG